MANSAAPRREETETADVNGLPAFLTNPVRQPIAVDDDMAPAVETGSEGEANGEFRARPRARRRRTRDFGSEGGAETGTDAPDVVETPPAE